MSSYELCKLGALVYPIMLAQETGEISEAKAAELLGLNLERYRERKGQVVLAVRCLVEQLPSPLTLLLDGTMALPNSLTQSGGS